LKQKRRKRGYPVAMLIGIEENVAVLWKIFSNIIKHEKTIQLGSARNDAKAAYAFHEAIVNALRTTLKEGVRSVILVSPLKSNYSKAFLAHVQLHHVWLTQGVHKASFSEMAGSADTLPKVATLAKNAAFHKLISETVVEESEALIELLEKRLNASSNDTLVFYSLKEIEDSVFGVWNPNKPKPDYLLLTDVYLAGFRAKSRLQRLMQIAANKGIKVRVVDVESAVGARVAQFGGLTLLLRN